MRPDAPQTLYKYRSLGGEFGREAVREAIENSRLYWQHPTDFNDPFDCNPRFIFGTSPQGRKRYARRVARERFAHLERSQRRKAVRGASGLSEEHARATVKATISKLVVTCFSKKHDCPLMWGHYADKHTGVALVFRETIDPVPFLAFDVIYRDERPVVDVTIINETVGDFYNDTILTKAHCWEYEQECRMVEHQMDAGYHRFPTMNLTGVILGARMTDGDREFVMNLARLRKAPLALYQASIDEELYAINVSPF